MKERKNEFGKKNIYKIGIFLIIITIILLGGALIYNKLYGAKSYDKIETIMADAAREYLKDRNLKAPNNINDTITLTDKTLIKANKMKDISFYLKDKSIVCSGEVKVTNINGNYRYAPFLDCGVDYKTQKFTDYINKNESIVTTGNGLYKLNETLVYRGEHVNNYLTLNNKTYRIVKFVDGHPVIIFTDYSQSVQWDNRYNIKTESSTGINDYEVSRIRDHLNNLYNENGKNALLSEDDRMLITKYDLPIGKRSENSNNKNGDLEKTKILTDQYIGLLPINDFLNASLDTNCTNTTNKSCFNYNYLNKYKYTWWSVTANSENTYQAYIIKDIVGTAQTDSYHYVRPVFYLATDTIYVSGNGTAKNPYVIK